MAVTKTATATATTIEVNPALEHARGFWERNNKPIIYVGSAIILLVGGILAYKYFIRLPKEREANKQIIAAEAIYDKMSSASFTKDSVNLALNGGTTKDGKKIIGLLKVVSNYGGTPAGNRARYMVGTSYLQIKDFDKAIKYLKDFEGNGANQIQSAAYAALAHAHAEKKNSGDALDFYKKAASVNEQDESLSPAAFMMAASYAQYIGKDKDAIELYNKVKEKYPTSQLVSSGEVDKQLASLGVLSAE